MTAPIRLTCLGSGSAFTVGDGNWQSNFLVEEPSGKRMLIDCGSDARLSLARLGLSAEDIDATYVSHLHSDHIGGLEWLAFSTFFAEPRSRPGLYACADLVGPLWEQALQAGLGSTLDGTAELGSYFHVTAVEPGQGFVWRDLDFTTVAVVHIESTQRPFPSYGLSFALTGKTVFLTSDTKFIPDKLMAAYASADIILHDCETAPIRSEVHSHYRDLVGLPAEIRRKMWLYHYQPGPRPDAVADGFCGFVAPGQVFV